MLSVAFRIRSFVKPSQTPISGCRGRRGLLQASDTRHAMVQHAALGRSLLSLFFGACEPSPVAQRPRSLTLAFEETPALRQFEVFKVHLALHTYH